MTNLHHDSRASLSISNQCKHQTNVDHKQSHLLQPGFYVLDFLHQRISERIDKCPTIIVTVTLTRSPRIGPYVYQQSDSTIAYWYTCGSVGSRYTYGTIRNLHILILPICELNHMCTIIFIALILSYDNIEQHLPPNWSCKRRQCSATRETSHILRRGERVKWLLQQRSFAYKAETVPIELLKKLENRFKVQYVFFFN